MKNKIKFLNIPLILLLSLVILSCENKPNQQNLTASADKETILVGEKTRILVEGINQNALNFKSKSDILSVDKYGFVTGEKAGTGMIEITHISGAATSISIKVVERPISIASFDIKLERQNLKQGETTKVIATTSLDDKNFQFQALNGLASVDKDGNVKAIKTGWEIIQIEHSSGYTKKLELNIVKRDIVARVEHSTISVGDKTQIIVDGIDTSELQFLSKNDVLAVERNGIVTGLTEGTGIIEIIHFDETIAYIEIKVAEKALNLATFDINLEKSTISLSEKTKVIATTTLEDKSFEYKAVNSIVDIDKDGNITPLKTGMEKIIVSHSSGYSKTLELKVTLPQSGDISIRNQNINTPPEGNVIKLRLLGPSTMKDHLVI